MRRYRFPCQVTSVNVALEFHKGTSGGSFHSLVAQAGDRLVSSAMNQHYRMSLYYILILTLSFWNITAHKL